MANILAPFGFSPNGTASGATPNFRLSKRLIASTNATAIFKGDTVSPVESTATGYITIWTSNTVVAGVFWGCTYLSVSQGRKVWSPYWPGSDASTDVTAYVIDNPDAQFVVQSGLSSGPITLANVNQNVPITTATAGSTLTGLSGQAITTPATTSTYPYMVVSLVTDPTGQNGTDSTTAYNWVVVTFNNEIFRTGNTSIS